MGLTFNLGRVSPSVFTDSSLNVGIGAAPSGSYKLEVTGTAKVSGVLTLSSTISNGTYTYTLPSATGTLALTSAIPANPVGGTGTTNYLPKFTGTSTIGNSVAYDNGSQIGIGQTTLFTKFSVADSLAATSVGSNYNAGIVNIQNTNTTNGNLSLIGFQDASAFINLAAFGAINEVHSGSPNNVKGSLAFYTKNSGTSYVTEKMRLDASGNLGLGVTPSAWYSAGGYASLQVGNASLFGRNSANSELYLSANAFDNSSGNPTYITTNFATRYVQNNGVHSWLTAPSGTAGNAITFTTALTLASTGAATFSIASGVYTAINITSPNTSVYYKLTPTGGDSYILGAGVAQTDDFCILNSTRSINYLKIIGGASGGAATFSSSVSSTWHSVNGAIPSSAASTGYIDYSGGTRFFSVGASGSTKGTFSFYAKGADDSSTIPLSIASTGAATFAGNINIVKTTPSIVLDGTGSGNSGAFINLCGWATTNKNWQIGVANVGPGGLLLSNSTAAGGTTFGTTVGTFADATGVYTPSSDINKKKDFEQNDIGLNAILNLKSTLYRMQSEDEKIDKHLGFIAQEVKPHIPQAYVEFGEGESIFIGLDYQAITSVIVKAIQELNERLNKAGI